MNSANYICIKGGRYDGYNENGERFSLPISDSDKVKIDFDLTPYNPYIGSPKISFQRLGDNYNGDNYNGDKYARICTERSIIYIEQGNISKSFRPIVHKHLAAKLCEDVDKLNEFLKTLPIDSLKDVKDCKTAWLVIYIDNGDDEK